MRRFMIGRLVLLLGAAAVPASAQETLLNIEGVGGGGHLGWAVSGVGDINQDGFPDVVVGAPDYSEGELADIGFTSVWSGKDEALLWSSIGVGAGDRYGQFVTEVGDLDQDGFPDFAVSATNANGLDLEDIAVGSCEVRSGADFSVIYRWYGDAPLDTFGDSASPAGDVNDDGWIDIVVGGRRHDGGGNNAGIARVFSGLDGSVLYDFLGEGDNWLTGSATDGAGDVNNDGFDDVIVGSRGASPNGLAKAGQAIVYSGLDGSELLRIDGPIAGDGLGSGVAGIGDVDLDGFDDIAIGSWMSDALGPNTGSAMVISGATGDVLYSWNGEHQGAVFGVWVDGPGDVNRDGWLDIVIGSNAANCTTVTPVNFVAGKVYVRSGKDGSLIFDVCGDGGGDGLGVVVSDPGDLNQDGYMDVMSGAYWNDFGGHDSGFARVYSGCPNVIPRTGPALAGSNGEPNLAACGLLSGNSPFTLKLINARPSAATILVLGFSNLSLPFHGGVLVPAPDVFIFGVPTDPAGMLELDASWPLGLPSGFELVMQFWIPDHGGTSGLSASNGIVATTP